MGLINVETESPGLVNVSPRIVRIRTTDNYATITAANYLNQTNNSTYSIRTSDVLFVSYGPETGTSFAIFTPSLSNGSVTLIPWVNSSDVLLPVVSGDFATFNGTSGQIKDAGYLPSNAAKTRVVMANGATIVNHLAAYTDTTGTVGIDVATAINGGNIQAGLSGTAGTLASFPGTASKGSLVLAAVANTGNTVTTISNAAMGQASVVSIPDPGVATSNFIIADSAGTQHITTGSLSVDVGNISAGSSGHAGTLSSFPGTAANGSLIIAGVNAGGAFTTTISNGTMGQSTVYTMGDIGATTGGLVVATSAIRMKAVSAAANAGGSATSSISDSFCTSGSTVIANWNTSANAVTIEKVTPGNGSFTVLSSGDPGASTLGYIIIK